MAAPAAAATATGQAGRPRSVFLYMDRRVNFGHMPPDAGLYELTRAWVQNDPNRPQVWGAACCRPTNPTTPASEVHRFWHRPTGGRLALRRRCAAIVQKLRDENPQLPAQKVSRKERRRTPVAAL